MGDSVVNGGVLTDHKDLATTILQEQLDPSRTKIQVCNIGVGSWGPGNCVGYFRKYQHIIGTNDILVVEVNSHDLWEDDPKQTGGRNIGKDIAMPDHKPWCALWDGFGRYLMPRIRIILGLSKVNTKVDVPKWEEDSKNEQAKYNLIMLDELFSLPFRGKALLIWRSRQEVRNGSETAGESAFRLWAKSRGIQVISVEANADEDYRDKIHPNPYGQKKIAEAIYRTL